MNNDKKNTASDFGGGLHIDVESISAGSNIQFAGRDATLHVHTGGDVSQTTSNTITVGGVKTTPVAKKQIEEKIEIAENKIEAVEVDEETKEAMRHYLSKLKEILLSAKKPNPKILIDTVKSLSRLSPVLLEILSEIFGVPLAIEIVEQLGPSANSFFGAFRAKFGG